MAKELGGLTQSLSRNTDSKMYCSVTDLQILDDGYAKKAAMP